jgi:type IV secretion system protein VirB5
MKLKNLSSRIKRLLRQAPDTGTENPYLNARRTWNLAVGSAINRGFVGVMVGV